MVYDLGIRYLNKNDTDQLISVLQEKYEVTQDLTGGLYYGITLKSDYKAIQLDILIPGFVKDAFYTLQELITTRPQHSLHLWTEINYG